MDRDMYNDVEVAWAEYEYVCSEIEYRIYNIIYEDIEDPYVFVEIKDATIVIYIHPCIPISTLKKIENFLGVDGYITLTQNYLIVITFYNKDAEVKE